MHAFEYLVGLISILIGLAIADLASSVHRLLRSRARVRWDWHAPAAVVVLVLLVLDVWWGVRQLEMTGVTITIGLFLPLLAALFIFFLLAAAALPDEVPSEGVDLRAYYFESSRYFWGLFALFVLLSSAHVLAIRMQLFDSSPETLVRSARGLGGNFIAATLAVTLMFIRHPWWHSAALALLVAALLFSHLTRPLA